MESSNFGHLILDHFCFNLGRLFGGYAAAVVLGYQFALLRNKIIVSERVASDYTALAGQAFCGALNGSPVHKNTKQRYCYEPHPQNKLNCTSERFSRYTLQRKTIYTPQLQGNNFANVRHLFTGCEEQSSAVAAS